MARWPRGQAEITQQLASRHLESVTGTRADGSPLLKRAHRTVATGAGLVSHDPYSAYVLAYDAARFACVAPLAQQGW